MENLRKMIKKDRKRQNMKYGSIVKGRVSDLNETDYFVQVDGVTFKLSKQHVDEALHIGQTVEGIGFENRQHHKVFQVEIPDIRPDYYGWAEVVSVRKDLGLFVDVGLKEKDVVVSIDDLPENTAIWPKKGDKLYLTYQVDDRNRFWGKIAPEDEYVRLFKKAPDDIKNNDIVATVYRMKQAGALCVTEEGYRAFIHHSEYTDTPRIGQVLETRCIHCKGDGTLNLSMKRRAHEALEDDAMMIRALLAKSPAHFIGLHDKSNPEDIMSLLGISKAQFKRAVGQLMKSNIITQEKGVGIRLHHDEVRD